jgi:hypothetical protein
LKNAVELAKTTRAELPVGRILLVLPAMPNPVIAAMWCDERQDRRRARMP